MDTTKGGPKKTFDKKAYRKKKYDKKTMIDKWNDERKTQMKHKYNKIKRKEGKEGPGVDVSKLYKDESNQQQQAGREHTQKPFFNKKTSFQQAQQR